jgi:cysteinyl-tRNA synthetase
LLLEFKKKHGTLDQTVISESEAAWKAYVAKNLKSLPGDTLTKNFKQASDAAYQNVLDGKSEDGSGPPSDKEAKIKMHLRTSQAAAEALQALQDKPGSLSQDAFYSKVDDVLLPYFDSLYGDKIDATDYTIFSRLTEHFEKLYFEDMRDLNVLDPDILTRVTEYCPQIVTFTEQIVKKGFAYATDEGNVYFDINAFEKAGNSYARLEPWSKGNQELIADGEGALSDKKTDKRSAGDFALIKKSLPGQPAWPSPWCVAGS